MSFSDNRGTGRSIVAASALSIVIATVLASTVARAQTEGGHSLFERFMAPCCWTESLATHDSPLARELRHELDARARAGETTTAIELDLVARYGERILAAPEALESASPALYALALAALLGLVVAGRRWTARAADEGGVETHADAVDERLERRLDDELEQFGD